MTRTPSRQPSAHVACLVFALALCGSAHAAAQERRPDTHSEPTLLALRLPFELGQGPIFSHGGLRYTWSGNLLPGFRYGVLELNADVAAVYYNPKWDFGLGGRASVELAALFEGLIGIRLGFDAQYLVPRDSARLATGLVLDVSSLLRIGLWPGYDLGSHDFYGFITVGSDVTTWTDPVGALVHAGPMEDFDARP